MKYYFVFFIAFGWSSIFSQLATVTGGNVGASVSVGALLNQPGGGGFGTSVGLTTGIREIFFPEIDYTFYKANYGEDSQGNSLKNQSFLLGMGLNNKIPIGSIKMGKSNKLECWVLNLKLLLDYKYKIKLSNQSNFGYPSGDEQLLNLGLGMRPWFSGSHKSRVAWTFFYDLYYQFDLNTSSYSGWNFKQNGVYLRFTFLHHKTADMLGGSSKKKSYNKKY